MNLEDTPQQAAFRAEVREFIATMVPAQLKGLRQGIVQGPGLKEAQVQPFYDALRSKGWRAPHWPREFGGAGFDEAHMVILTEEFTRAALPGMKDVGLDMLGMILIAYGTKAQQERFLGPTLRGELTWAQGYSEPQAGSDLANLALRCDVTDDGFLLNGQKIWTSKAHIADWLFLLVRTDSTMKKKQDGISFLLLDMKTPGITVRPIHTIDDHHHFNETFFDNVKVPRANLVGELHKGWKLAKSLLSHERFSHPTSDPLVIGRALDNLKGSARALAAGEGMVWDDPVLRRRVTQLDMDVDCLRYTRYRALTKVMHGDEPGPETMMFKMFGAELMQRIVELHAEVMGPLGTIWERSPFPEENGETAKHGANIRAATIRGGTSEVQRNIIAKNVLNLP
ncbi:MAG: acyl-CoA dehydrogenase family protein [Candidatus Lambdaproteobacteria bacterium]|nr:acyl-CoA dehydrogenase family protein [Candidatus Lambdaproteobacteria bacterium]